MIVPMMVVPCYNVYIQPSPFDGKTLLPYHKETLITICDACKKGYSQFGVVGRDYQPQQFVCERLASSHKIFHGQPRTRCPRCALNVKVDRVR